jgi:hypothetical protein
MAKSNSSENIAHCVLVRMSALGLGSLRTLLITLDNVKAETLALTVLQPTGDIYPTQLANFKSQRMCVMLYTTDIDQYFIIGKVIPFVKPSSAGYPQF